MFTIVSVIHKEQRIICKCHYIVGPGRREIWHLKIGAHFLLVSPDFSHFIIFSVLFSSVVKFGLCSSKVGRIRS